jgi:RNA polymerase sigma factor (sigma-70 family)
MFSEQEFLRAIEEHQNILHKVCNLYMDSAEDREDLFQEILLNAWKGIRNYKGQAKFSTWLYRVGLNTAITFYRKRRRKLTIVPLLDQENVLSGWPPDADQKMVNTLYRAIGSLSSVDKALVMLYLEDYSYPEIGEILGITPNNVAVKMNRIREKLKIKSKFLTE